MAWQTFALPKVPSGVSSAVDGLKTIASTASTALKLVKELVEALSATADTGLSSSQTAINVAVSSIESAVKSLTEDAGVYVLLVPPRSLVLIPEAVKAALSPTIIVSPTTQGLNTQALFSGESVTSAESKILQELFSATGGNAGFVRTVTESFGDLGDDNRPQLTSTDTVAGFYLVAGAANFSDLIPFTNGISSILAPGKPTALDAPSIPNPQNLSAKLVAGGDVQLKWTAQPAVVELPTLGTFARITEVAILRSTSIKFLSTTTPYAVFGDRKLTAGKKTDDELTEVIAVLPYSEDAEPNSYLDTTIHDPGRSYYYAVSFHVVLGTSKEISDFGGIDLNFLRLSNVVKVYLSKEAQGAPRSISGVPPDWYRTPRTVDLFPALGNLLTQVSSITAQLGDTTSGYGDMLKSNVKAIEQQIKGYTDLASKLTAASSSISSLSSIDLGAVSSRSFSGTGGVNFIKKDIVKAFGDTSDPNRPPFDNNEFVSGVVILATTPGAIALLNQILGSVGTGISVIANALAKIDVQLGTLETATTSDPPASSPAALTSLVGEEAGYCYQSFEPSVEFDDELNPI